MNHKRERQAAPSPNHANHEITSLAQFVSKNVVLSIFAFTLLLCAELFEGLRPVFLVAGLLCGLSAIFLTYSIGGQRRFSQDWTFFQPLKGLVFSVCNASNIPSCLLIQVAPVLLFFKSSDGHFSLLPFFSHGFHGLSRGTFHMRLPKSWSSVLESRLFSGRS